MQHEWKRWKIHTKISSEKLRGRNHAEELEVLGNIILK
jgi:hypothetical protein